jgi:YggT family protein
MDIIFIPLLAVINIALGIYIWIIIASVIMSWLLNFNVINSNNNFVFTIINFLYKTTEPVLGRIRRFVPAISGFDLSPVVLILLIWFLQMVIGRILMKLFLVSSV